MQVKITRTYYPQSAALSFEKYIFIKSGVSFWGATKENALFSKNVPEIRPKYALMFDDCGSNSQGRTRWQLLTRWMPM